MKRIISILLVAALTLSCFGCSKKNLDKNLSDTNQNSSAAVSSSGNTSSDTSAASNTAKSDAAAATTSAEKSDTTSSASTADTAKSSSDGHTGIDAEDEDFVDMYFSSAAPGENIDVALPLSWINISTEEELNTYVKENGYQKGVITEDVGIITMTGAQHNELLNNLNTEIRNQLNDLVGAEDTPHVTSAEATRDFTEFSLIFDGELNFTENFLVIGLMYWGGLWNVIAGTPVPEQGIHIVYYNADSGDIFYDSYDEVSSSISWDDDDWDLGGGSTTNFSEPTIDPYDIIDTSKIRVSLTSIIPNDSWGYTINLDAENKTASALSFELGYTSVNGYMISSGNSAEIEPNAVISTYVTIDSEKILEIGIEEPTSISFLIKARDSEDWMEENLYINDIYTIYPLGADRASERYSFDYEGAFNRGETAIKQGYEGNGYGYILYDIDPDGMWGFTFKTYAYNNTDKTLSINANDFVCNGWQFTAMGLSILTPNTCCFDELSFSADTMALLNMDTIHSMTFGLKVMDYNDQSGDPILEQKVSYTDQSSDAANVVSHPGQIVLVENPSDLKLVIYYNPVQEEEFWGRKQYKLPFFIEQYCDRSFYYYMDNVKLNGTDYDPFWGSGTNGAQNVYVPFTWASRQLEDMGIDTVKTITFTLLIYDNEIMDADECLIYKKDFSIEL